MQLFLQAVAKSLEIIIVKTKNEFINNLSLFWAARIKKVFSERVVLNLLKLQEQN